MRNKLALYLLPVLLAASTALAQFEGVMEMRLTLSGKDGAAQGEGTMKLAVSKAGARTEMKMQMQQMAMNTVMLFKNDNTNTVYRINDAAKTYTVIDLAKLRAMAPPAQADEKFTVKKLGEAKILAYKTQHVLVTVKNTSTELWTAKDLLDYDTFSKLQARNPRPADAEALDKALKDAEADGVPLKSIATAEDGTKMTMEVVKVEKLSLPASTFDIPAGYTKSEGGKAGPQVDAARKKLNEAMKNMSPAQREIIERMMKQRQGGNQ